jgi:predicted nuclease with TOPRIM domain
MASEKDILLQELRAVKEAICEVQEDISKLKGNQERNEKMTTQLLQIVGATNAKVGSFAENIVTLQATSTQMQAQLAKWAEKIQQQDERLSELAELSQRQEQEIVELKQTKTA